jgi:hypothetical protein
MPTIEPIAAMMITSAATVAVGIADGPAIRKAIRKRHVAAGRIDAN